MPLCIFLCRCFDRQGYCSRGWCLDTGWHCAAPWAHAQIREDIRNPSLHVLFNHTGWRGNVFMDLIVKQYIVYLCVCIYVPCPKHVCFLTMPLSCEWTWHIHAGCVSLSRVCRTSSSLGKRGKEQREGGRSEGKSLTPFAVIKSHSKLP